MNIVVAQNDNAASNNNPKLAPTDGQTGQPQGIAPTDKTVCDMVAAFEFITTVEYHPLKSSDETIR